MEGRAVSMSVLEEEERHSCLVWVACLLFGSFCIQGERLAVPTQPPAHAGGRGSASDIDVLPGQLVGCVIVSSQTKPTETCSFHRALQVLDLISSDSLNVPSEEEVYRAVLSWVKHDVDSRRQHVPRVSVWVRWPGSPCQL